ncbi:hypothetical protein TNCV_429801 [Trichonephila clavipes]|nr:hypothetical protein TNCV_429801 [Trichonephila clavipes]
MPSTFSEMFSNSKKKQKDFLRALTEHVWYPRKRTGGGKVFEGHTGQQTCITRIARERVTFTSHYTATRGLLVTEILNNGQVTRMTPELAHLSPNFHTIPTEGRLSLDMCNVYRPSLQGVSSAVLGLNSGHTSHEFMNSPVDQSGAKSF